MTIRQEAQIGSILTSGKIGYLYDYTHQCWLDGDDNLRVTKCGHIGKHPLCYSCNHAGEFMPKHDNIH